MSRPIYNCIHCWEDCDWAGIERLVWSEDECELGIIYENDEVDETR
ncbi:hypothetical protein M1O54_00010 [Dehalococcoidia bacterium]|nr:hypothetical protein [Dehalococcoidia bacterium]